MRRRILLLYNMPYAKRELITDGLTSPPLPRLIFFSPTTDRIAFCKNTFFRYCFFRFIATNKFAGNGFRGCACTIPRYVKRYWNNCCRNWAPRLPRVCICTYAYAYAHIMYELAGKLRRIYTARSWWRVRDGDHRKWPRWICVSSAMRLHRRMQLDVIRDGYSRLLGIQARNSRRLPEIPPICNSRLNAYWSFDFSSHWKYQAL